MGGFFEKRPKWIAGGYFRRVHKSGAVGCELLGLGKATTSLGLARKNSNAILGDALGQVFHLSSTTCKLLHRLIAHQRPVVAVAVAPTAWLAVSVDANTRTCWWNTLDGKLIACRTYPAK